MKRKEDYREDRFTLVRASKGLIEPLLTQYHYLTGVSKGFRCGFNYAMIDDHGEPHSAIIFTGLPVPEVAVGAFELDRKDQAGLFELSRLVVRPDSQYYYKNFASWFIGKAIDRLRDETEVRAIISYADNNFHKGSIYAATNWTYCGLTAPKFDYCHEDGSIASRGTTKWKRPRTRKHRFVKVFDSNLALHWLKQDWAKSVEGWTPLGRDGIPEIVPLRQKGK